MWTKTSLSYHLCFEYFSQFKIDSETHTYMAAVLEEKKNITKQGEILRHIQEEFIITFVEMIEIHTILINQLTLHNEK